MLGRLAGYASILTIAACGDLVERLSNIPTQETGDTAIAGDIIAPDVPEGIACESDEDCAPYAGCCVDPRCQDGVCLPFYVPGCCTSPGPCATTSAFRSGTCETTCVRNGCVERWNPPHGTCADVLQTLALDTDGLAELALDDPDPTDRIAWTLSTRRPFAGRASLFGGDFVCPTYYDGPLDSACRPLSPGADGSPVMLGLRSPSVTLPLDRPAYVEAWLWIDVGDGHVDGVVISAEVDGIGLVPLWDSRSAHPPRGVWIPVAADLGSFAGNRIQIDLTFDTLDGRDNHHEGVYLGALAIRTACEDDVACPAGATGACAEPRAVLLSPFDSTICALAPADPGPACIPCQTGATCPVADTCDHASCDAGRCVVTHALDAACCTPSARWPGDPSFEGALDDAWEVDPGWAVSAIESFLGEMSLHFGLIDGTGYAEPGLAARGTAWSPPLTLPPDAPFLSFALYLATEWDEAPSRDNPAGIDRLDVLLRPAALLSVGAPPEAVIWSSREIGGTTRGRWVRIRVALDGAGGAQPVNLGGTELQIGFRFDTGDEHDNDALGAFIDDIRTFRACPGCGSDELAPDCDPGFVGP